MAEIDALWSAYTAAEAQARQLFVTWAQIMQAGGFAPAAGRAYGAAFRARAVADTAYQAWLDARRQLYQAPPSG